MTQTIKQTDFEKAYRDRKITVLMEAFKNFEARSRTLEQSFKKMQEDFKQLNIELDKKNNYLKSILESITSGIVAVDIQGKITNFSKGAEILTGFKNYEVEGKPYMEIFGKDVSREDTLLYTLDCRKHTINKEKELSLSNGSKLPVRFSTSLIQDSSGNILGAVEFFIDISEIRKMESEMQRIRTLSALGEMSAAVAHEIRNPLGAIGGFAALLERDVEINDPRRKLVKKIIQGVAGLNKIVSNLLMYTRPMKGDFRDVCIKEILSDTLDFALLSSEGKSPKQIKVNKVFPTKKVLTKCDPEKMHQLFLNIFQNSIAAMNEKGVLTIRIEEHISKHLILDHRDVKGIIEISVHDTGCGISKENIDKLFNPFFTTRLNGTGLGLAIVKKIVELHHGEIIVVSEDGEGACFIVKIPK